MATSSAIPRVIPDTEEDELLDWDVCMETTPPRPSGTIRVHLEYVGRSKPIFVEDPES